MTKISNCCCCFSCFSGRNTPPPSAPSNASSADIVNTLGAAASPTVATRPDPDPDQIPRSTSTSNARGKSIEPSFPSTSADQYASSSAVVKVVPPPSVGASSTVPETGTSSSTQPGEGSSSAPQRTKSSSSITNVNKDAAAPQGDSEEVDLDGLIEHISQHLQLIIQERRKPPGLQRYWPTASKTFLKLKEFISEINVIPGDAVKTAVDGVLQGMGMAQLVGAGLFVVGNMVERFEEVGANKAECLRLLEEMISLAKVVKQFKESPQAMYDVIKDATELIFQVCAKCFSQIDSSKFSKFFKAPVNKEELDNCKQEIDSMYRKIIMQMSICILHANGREEAPPSRGYPNHAVGIEEPVKEIIDLLELTSVKKAIAIMVHGYEGIGKTTVADAVVSLADIQGFKYSKVQLSKNIDSAPKIVELQRLILKDLMGGQTFPDIRSEEDGQRGVGYMLEKVPAFIYIDNVSRLEELRQLLPKDMKNAKKVRLLLTARDRDLRDRDLRRALRVTTISYPIKGLHDTEAMQLLRREIYYDETDYDREEQINSTHLKQIVQSCGGIPKLLELVGGFIGAEKNKQKAYKIWMEHKNEWEILMEDKEKWESTPKPTGMGKHFKLVTRMMEIMDSIEVC